MWLGWRDIYFRPSPGKSFLERNSRDINPTLGLNYLTDLAIPALLQRVKHLPQKLSPSFPISGKTRMERDLLGLHRLTRSLQAPQTPFLRPRVSIAIAVIDPDRDLFRGRRQQPKLLDPEEKKRTCSLLKLGARESKRAIAVLEKQSSSAFRAGS